MKVVIVKMAKMMNLSVIGESNSDSVTVTAFAGSGSALVISV